MFVIFRMFSLIKLITLIIIYFIIISLSNNAIAFNWSKFVLLQDYDSGLVLDQSGSTIKIIDNQVSGHIIFYSTNDNRSHINKLTKLIYDDGWDLVNIIDGKRSSYIFYKKNKFISMYIFHYDSFMSIDLFIY